MHGGLGYQPDPTHTLSPELVILFSPSLFNLVQFSYALRWSLTPDLESTQSDISESFKTVYGN